jgi:hypothetical protein
MTFAPIPLFSYGTLQLESVQLSQFGARLDGEPDAVIGYRRSEIEIADAATVSLSGSSIHAILVETGDPLDQVEGTLFYISADQLDAADHYEVSDYKRVEVKLRSGRSAWAYVQA